MENKPKKNKVWLKIIISAIVAIALYIVLLSMQSSMLKAYEKTPVYVTKQEIPNGTVVNKDNLNSLFVKYDVDAKLVTDSSITEEKDLLNKLVRHDMNPSEIVNENDLGYANEATEKLGTPVEMSVTVNGLSNAVGGRLRSGRTVDISVVNSASGECDYVLEDVYITKAMTADGQNIPLDDDKTPAIVFNVLVDKSDVNDLTASINSGVVVITYPNDDANVIAVQNEIKDNIKAPEEVVENTVE